MELACAAFETLTMPLTDNRRQSADHRIHSANEEQQKSSC